MPWKLKLNENPKYIEVSYIDNITPAEFFEAFSSAISLAMESGTKVCLTDCTAMLGELSIMDLSGMIKVFESNEYIRETKEAVLLPSQAALSDNVLFYENACQNRGYNVRIFNDRETALLWLCGKNSH